MKGSRVVKMKGDERVKMLVERVEGVGVYNNCLAIALSSFEPLFVDYRVVDDVGRGVHESIILCPEDPIITVYSNYGWIDVTKCFLELAFEKFGLDVYEYAYSKGISLAFRRNDRVVEVSGMEEYRYELCEVIWINKAIRVARSIKEIDDIINALLEEKEERLKRLAEILYQHYFGKLVEDYEVEVDPEDPREMCIKFYGITKEYFEKSEKLPEVVKKYLAW